MRAAFRRLQRSVDNMLARIVVAGLNSATKCQTLQVNILANEQKENVEHMEPYGFTSAPLTGAEGVALFPDGDRSHGVIMVVSDRRYRIKGLVGGEVAIYTDEGDSITLKRGNTINVQTKNYFVNTENYTANVSGDYLVKVGGSCTIDGKDKITLTATTVEATQDFTAGGDVSDKSSSMQALRDTYDDHDHVYDDGTTEPPTQKM